MIHNERSTTLAGLAVDADNRLVFASDVGRIDRQIRNLPIWGFRFAHIFVPFVDRILMGAGECGEGKFACIWPALRNMHLGAALIDISDMVDVREIELRVNALRIHVQCDSYDVQIAGAFTITEECAFNAVGAREHGQFGTRDARAAVVVRVDGDNCSFTIGQMANEILNLVGVGIGRTHFNGVGKIKNDRILFCCTKRFHDLMTDVHSEVHFCP